MTPADEKTLRAKFVQILLYDACTHINFTIEGTTIRGLYYKTCAQAISAGKVGFRVEDLSDGEGASYIPSRNRIVVPKASYGLTTEEQQGIIHESTHLWIDISRKKTLAIVNEMCAFVAGAIFYRILTGESKIEMGVNSTFMAADIVAGRILAGESLDVRPGLTDVNDLRYAIWQQPIYSDLNKHRNYDYGQDGI